MRSPQGFEWLVILLIVMLLFGSKRLPEMARGLGRSLRILKAETRGLTQDDDAQAPGAQAPGVQTAAVNAPVVQAAAEPEQTRTDKTAP